MEEGSYQQGSSNYEAFRMKITKADSAVRPRPCVFVSNLIFKQATGISGVTLPDLDIVDPIVLGTDLPRAVMVLDLCNLSQ